MAYGVAPDGKRRLLGVTIGPEESAATWTELLEQLLARGLQGVTLVIADEHAGLLKAVRHLLPEAKRQRCVVHYADQRIMPSATCGASWDKDGVLMRSA